MEDEKLEKKINKIILRCFSGVNIDENTRKTADLMWMFFKYYGQQGFYPVAEFVIPEDYSWDDKNGYEGHYKVAVYYSNYRRKVVAVIRDIQYDHTRVYVRVWEVNKGGDKKIREITP